MSTQFLEQARLLAGLAGSLLSWRPDDFWNSTPAELAAIISALSPHADVSADSTTITQLKEIFPDG
jgi:hypothetical protein